MSPKRWLNGTTSRNANSTCTPGSATRSSPSSWSRLRSSRSFSVSSPSVSLLCGASMPGRKTEPARRLRRAGSCCYLERDLDEEPERLPPEPDPLERLDAEPERAFVDRLDVEPERALGERLEDEPERAFVDRLDAEPDRELLAREPEPLDFARLDEPERLDEPDRERLELFDELRERLDDERRELDRDEPLRRSAAGISSLATAFASCGICFSRNFAMRSSSRRMPRASLAVSLSFTASASASMPV